MQPPLRYSLKKKGSKRERKKKKEEEEEEKKKEPRTWKDQNPPPRTTKERTLGRDQCSTPPRRLYVESAVHSGLFGLRVYVHACVYVSHTHTHTCARARTRTRGAYRRSSRRGRKDGDEARLYGARTRASKSGGRSSGLCCGRQLRGWRSGLHPRRGWRGVDQYVKIESDATHPAPQAPLRASTAARSG